MYIKHCLDVYLILDFIQGAKGQRLRFNAYRKRFRGPPIKIFQLHFHNFARFHHLLGHFYKFLQKLGISLDGNDDTAIYVLSKMIFAAHLHTFLPSYFILYIYLIKLVIFQSISGTLLFLYFIRLTLHLIK